MSEILPLVDENDNLIGFKEREKIESTDINRASGLWITNSQGQILLARRAAGKSNNPNRWGPAVTGTVSKEETYDSCIIREAEEELGIKDLSFLPVSKLKSFGFNPHFVQWYSCLIDYEIAEFQIQTEEVAEIKWFTKEEVIDILQNHPEDFVDTVETWIHLFIEQDN